MQNTVSFSSNFVLLVVLAFASCVKSKNEACPNVPQYQALTTSAKQWLPYNSTKSIVFEDAAHTKDTLELSRLFAGDENIWTGDRCATTTGEFIKVDFFDKRSNETISTQLGMQDELRIFTKRNNIVFYDTKTLLLDASPYKKYHLSLTLNSKVFSPVLSLECSPQDNCNTAGFTQLFFSKRSGLVAYVRDGKMWTLY